jgi:DNA-binding transcriptional MocR family regulator
MPQFSQRCQNLSPSLIREILSIIDKPGMVSFAGGLPAPETLSIPSLEGLPASLLQYGPAEGELELRQLICADLDAAGLHCSSEQILILSGSQQGIDLVAKLFVDPGTLVALESPTYLAALQVFRFFGATFTPLEKAIENCSNIQHESPALIYAQPTFQNPTGHCYSRKERQALADYCLELKVPLFEDDPYRDLVFEECERRPVCSNLHSGTWVYQSSFSKTFAPGLRLGYLACSADLIAPLTRLKQAADLHSNRISQWLVMEQLKNPQRKTQRETLAATYKKKRDNFAALLNENFSDLATWPSPKGGLFFWLALKRKTDTHTLLAKAIEANVAFMPGESFFPFTTNQDSTSNIRLNFSHASTEAAEYGLKTLAALVRCN